jgi:mono/diheme cytochrome c family protein
MTGRYGFRLAVVLACAGICTIRAQAPLAPKDAVDPDHAAKMAMGLDLFKKKVKPLLEQRCLRCHGGKNVESEFDLTDRAGLLKGGLSGPAIVAGRAKDSLLLKLISHAQKPQMPKSGPKLSAEAIAQIANWIDLGAPYDDPLLAGKAKKKSWTGKVLPPEAKQFWSFEPLMKKGPPAVVSQAWCATPVDRFILARLEAAGIAPNPPAEKHRLVRRAYFDLLGLPPAPEEIEAFVNDTAPDAYARLIERLLASPHYGERWARHWLDLARFAESHGFEHDYDRPSAYHYRDAVIEAFNQDVPYDTFVKWQIAGDEYEPANNLAVKLTGFLAAGVHSTQITKNEVEKHRYDEMDDKLATLSTAFLGLTVGCARCHDHKYDAIPQRDYYRLLAAFTTTVRSEMELNLDPAGYQKAKERFERDHAPLEAALKKYEESSLPGRFAAWDKSHGEQDVPWSVLVPKSVQSKEGATLTVLSDGSVLASGKNPQADSYVVVLNAEGGPITHIRLEALTHPTLPKRGPGRAASGNFALSDFAATVPTQGKSPAGAPSGPQPLRLKNPRATFEQKAMPITAAIDRDPKSAWAIDPKVGTNHAAVFECETPLEAPAGSPITFTLKFSAGGHGLGRFRLSVTSAAQSPELIAAAMPSPVRKLLGSGKRTPEELEEAVKWYRFLDAGWLELHQKVEDHLAAAPKPQLAKVLVATEGLPAVRLHTQGEDFLPETHFLRRGDVANKEGVATPGYLQVLMPTPDSEGRWRHPPPPGWRTSYRRRALAEWITDTEAGAGQLLARVIVNRLWQHHLGRGLVATPSDFGTRGTPPTHPELLDYLAGELIRNGWRLKPIHKLLMTSAVYMQGSHDDEGKAKLDRDNKLCWRNPARRLEAEVIRDALLAVSGRLDRKLFGPGTLDPDSTRRSIYFTVKRSKLVPMMVIFDAPEALSGMAERPTTTIAPQALHLMNSPQVRANARALARRIAPESSIALEQAVRTAYLVTLARTPSSEELADSVAFVSRQLATYSGPEARALALADFCQVLMCLNEFVYVE